MVIGENKELESAANAVEGESLLLPLLQGLLLNKKNFQRLNSMENRNQNNNYNDNQSNELPRIPPVEDSGTESGEDLRLLAAGLHDNIELHRADSSHLLGPNNNDNALDNGLLTEVTLALERLQKSLVTGTQLNLQNSKRNSLLNLVSRLQQGLLAPDNLTPQGASLSPSETSPTDPDKKFELNRKNTGGRFAKRKNRNNRHTVGVSREELADARRFMEEMVMIENLSNSTNSPEVQGTPPKFPYSLQKQSSACAVLTAVTKTPLVLLRPSQFVPKDMQDKETPLMKLKLNSVDNEPAVIHSAPIVHVRDRKPKNKLFRQSLSLDQASPLLKQSPFPFPNVGNSIVKRSLPDEVPHDQPNVESKLRKFQPNVGSKGTLFSRKFAYNKTATADSSSEDEMDNSHTSSMTDETVFQKNLYNRSHHGVNMEASFLRSAVEQPKPEVKPAVNGKGFPPISLRSRTPPGIASVTSSNSNPYVEEKPVSKYSNKKLRMKRANTVDIPKSEIFLNSDKENSDDEDDESPENRNKKEGLKGTVQVSVKNPVSHAVPEFSPKTENDHKFLAFIQKQNNSNGLAWNNPVKEQKVPGKAPGHQNWSSKFGNLKKNFEDQKQKSKSVPIPKHNTSNSAMNFWKKAETQKPEEIVEKSHIKTYHPIEPTTPNAIKSPPALKTVPTSTTKFPWQEKPTKKIEVEQKTFQPIQDLQPAVIAKPVPVNQFSHAPASAFKPPPKKIQPAQMNFKPIQPEIKPIASNISNGIVKKMATNGYKETPFIVAPKLPNSPTKSIGLSAIYQTQKMEKPISPIAPVPWANKTSSDSRVLNIASSKFENNHFGIAHKANFQTTPQMPPMHQQPSIPSNSVTNGYKINEKRPSLPNNVYVPYYSDDMDKAGYMETYQNTKMNEHIFSNPTSNSSSGSIKSPAYPYYNAESDASRLPKPTLSNPLPDVTQTSDQTPNITYTFTDFTQPYSVSTYDSAAAARRDSLTNPDAEPLVLTNSHCLYQPQSLKAFDYQSSSSISPLNLDDSIDDDMDASDSTEYKAVAAKVMSGPVCQTAVTVGTKTKHIGDEFDGKGSVAALNLHKSLKKIHSEKSPTPETKVALIKRLSQDSSDYEIKRVVPVANISPPKIEVKSPTSPAVLEFPGHAIYNNVTATATVPSQPQAKPADLPPHMLYNNVSSSRSPISQYDSRIPISVYNNTSPDNRRFPISPLASAGAPLSKSDSWHQIHLQQNSGNMPPAVPTASRHASAMNNLQRAKSNHSLAVPKQFTHSDMTRSDMMERQKTVAAYFSGEKSPNNLVKTASQHNLYNKNDSVAAMTQHVRPVAFPAFSATSTATAALSAYAYEQQQHQQQQFQRQSHPPLAQQESLRRTAINRTQTHGKVSISKQSSSGLARSRTMPLIPVALLDEDNVEDAFEQLINS